MKTRKSTCVGTAIIAALLCINCDGEAEDANLAQPISAQIHNLDGEFCHAARFKAPTTRRANFRALIDQRGAVIGVVDLTLCRVWHYAPEDAYSSEGRISPAERGTPNQRTYAYGAGQDRLANAEDAQSKLMYSVEVAVELDSQSSAQHAATVKMARAVGLERPLPNDDAVFRVDESCRYLLGSARLQD